LGAKVDFGPFATPDNMGSVAGFTDTNGAYIGVWAPSV